MDNSPTAASQSAAPAERAYHRRIRAWSLYDWADHAVITTMAGTFFPPYFIAIAAPALLLANQAASGQAQAEALARDTASNYYAFAVSLALFIAAVVAPIIGAYSDIRGWRKRLLVLSTIVGGGLASLTSSS